MHESSFCAATVPSKRSRGARQLSQPPQGPLGPRLAEVGEQRGAAGSRRLGEAHHLVELGARAGALGRGRLLLDEAGLLDRVAGVEEQQALARQAVAPGAPGLLVVALEVLGQIVVDDEAHVGLVDAHAEGHRRADHAHLVAHERLLGAVALLGRRCPAW